MCGVGEGWGAGGGRYIRRVGRGRKLEMIDGAKH